MTEVGHDLEGSERNIQDHSRKATMMLLLKRCLGRGAESLSNLGTRGPRCHTTQPKSANGRGVPPPNAGCADTLLLGAAWVLCAPPSRALGTVATAGKALNHGTDDHQPVLLMAVMY